MPLRPLGLFRVGQHGVRTSLYECCGLRKLGVLGGHRFSLVPNGAKTHFREEAYLDWKQKLAIPIQLVHEIFACTPVEVNAS